MAGGTPATALLAEAGLAFTLHPYAYAAAPGAKGIAAAEALGVPPREVLKTLMILVDERPACAIVPSDAALSLKHAAAALEGRQTRLMPAADAERITGYRIGGISPFGQRRAVPTLIEATALAGPSVFINAGRRGLLLRLNPAAVARRFGWRSAGLIL